MKDGISWENLLRPEGPSGDDQWARFAVGPGAEIEEQIRNLAAHPPPGGADAAVVRGERSRSRPDLLREFARSLSFPGWFDHNWDAFDDSLSDVVGREQHEEYAYGGRPDAVLVLVANSQDLLKDESEAELKTLVTVMRSAALGLAWEDEDRPRLAELRVLFQCEPDEAEECEERLARVGLHL